MKDAGCSMAGPGRLWPDGMTAWRLCPACLGCYGRRTFCCSWP